MKWCCISDIWNGEKKYKMETTIKWFEKTAADVETTNTDGAFQNHGLRTQKRQNMVQNLIKSWTIVTSNLGVIGKRKKKMHATSCYKIKGPDHNPYKVTSHYKINGCVLVPFFFWDDFIFFHDFWGDDCAVKIHVKPWFCSENYALKVRPQLCTYRNTGVRPTHWISSRMKNQWKTKEGTSKNNGKPRIILPAF